jgi:hypothetical protein
MMLLLWLQGCVIGGDKHPRPRDLPQAWLVERPRILAIQAEPPEALPGQDVTFSALIGMPPEEEAELGVLWLACPVSDEGNGFGCVTDFGAIDLESLDPQALAELGVIGFQPGFDPQYTVPAELLDGMDAQQRLEGSYVLIQVTALPMSMIEEPVDDVDFSEIQSGYKRLIVSEAPTPNHNPDIGAITVDGLPVPAEAEVVHVEPSQSYDLGALLPEGAIESYVYLNRDGQQEERVEEPYVTWFTTSGELVNQFSLWPGSLAVPWTAPAEEGAGTWYAVLRDRRGGMSWYVQDFVVGRP